MNNTYIVGNEITEDYILKFAMNDVCQNRWAVEEYQEV